MVFETNIFSFFISEIEICYTEWLMMINNGLQTVNFQKYRQVLTLFIFKSHAFAYTNTCTWTHLEINFLFRFKFAAFLQHAA